MPTHCCVKTKIKDVGSKQFAKEKSAKSGEI